VKMGMPKKLRACAATLGALLVFVLPTSAQPAPTVERLPSHSHPADFGSGWACNRGYPPLSNACVLVKVPPHAYLDASGVSWQCERGFHSRADQCARVVLPQNAHLTQPSDDKGWECDRGYNDLGGRCETLNVPIHARPVYGEFNSYWECQRGYHRQGYAICARLESLGDRCVSDNLSKSRVAEDDVVEKFRLSRERPLRVSAIGISRLLAHPACFGRLIGRELSC
jgi:hypothetical protein